MTAYLVELPSVGGLTLPEGANKFVVFDTSVANARLAVQAHFGGDADAVIAAAVTTVTEIVAGTDMAGYEGRVTIIGAAAQVAPLIDITAKGTRIHIGGVTLNDGGTATYVIDDILTAVGGTFTRAATFRVTTVSTGVITAVELVDPGDYDVAPSLVANAVTGGGGTVALLDMTIAVEGSYEAIVGQLVTELNAHAEIAGADVDLSEGAAGARLLTVAAIADNLGDGTMTFTMSKNKVAYTPLVSTIVHEGIAAAVLTAAVPASALPLPSITPVKG